MTTAQPSSQFLDAMDALQQTQDAFARGQVSAVLHAHERQAALGRALTALASIFGVRLQQPLYIDSNGEFSVVALKPSGEDPRFYGCGAYGTELAALLTRHKGRTGAYGPATFEASSGWCRLNHFNAERLVKEYAKSQELELS